MTMVNVIMKHNYVQYNDQQYKREEGLAMGAPSSAILTETFIQYMEHNHIVNILNKFHIQDYYRYVDDILMIYNEDTTNIDDMIGAFNLIHPNIQFTIEKQIHNALNYLDITIAITHKKLHFNIYRKPTTTDLMIHNDSCHLQEHKYLGIKYLIHKMNTYPISKENKSREAQYINIILKNNNYQLYTHKYNNKNKENTTNTAQKTKWATFTFTNKKDMHR
jgi:hypothetical protein